MAETTTTSTPTATTRRPPQGAGPQGCGSQARPARRLLASAPLASRAARRAGTSRPQAAKSPTTATGRRNRTIAANETREAAQANLRAAKTTAKQGRNVAERAALVSVGVTLEARDRAAALVGDLPDVEQARAARHHRPQAAGARRQEGPHAHRARAARPPPRRRAPRPPQPRAGRDGRLLGEGPRRVDRVSDPTLPRPTGWRAARDRESSPASYPAGGCSTLSSLNRRRAFGHGGGA